MSGNSHDSPIKTPKQLVTVLVLAFVVPIILIVLLSQLATSGRIFDKDSPAMSPEEIAKRIKPVADVAVGGGGPGAKVLKTGEQVYQAVCTACHATGIAKAPKFGDKRDWGAAHPRRARRRCVQVALKGEGAMPPRGGASDLSDLEVERAVVYMANAGGAKFRSRPRRAPAPAPQPRRRRGRQEGLRVDLHRLPRRGRRQRSEIRRQEGLGAAPRARHRASLRERAQGPGRDAAPRRQPHALRRRSQGGGRLHGQGGEVAAARQAASADGL